MNTLATMNPKLGKEYRLGVTLIFRHHLELFALAQKVVSVTDESMLRGAAIEFYSFMQKHFSDQNSLMREINFPGYLGHVELHSDLLSKFSEIRKEIARGRPNTSQILAFMTQDLFLHICEEDAKIAAHFRASMGQPQEQPVVDRQQDRRLARRLDKCWIAGFGAQGGSRASA